MSRLIKGSSIRPGENLPPPTPETLHAPQRGGKGGGSVLASPDISPRASTLHAPRLAPQVPLGAPPLKEGRALLRLQNGGCRALIPPSRQPTHPYFHLSAALLEEKRGDGLFGWVGGWAEGAGGGPLFHPDEFSNFLWLQCFVPNSRP